MAECEGIATCPAYNGKNSEETKDNYCRNNNLHCARYLVFNSCGKEDKARAYLYDYSRKGLIPFLASSLSCPDFPCPFRRHYPPQKKTLDIFTCVR